MSVSGCFSQACVLEPVQIYYQNMMLNDPFGHVAPWMQRVGPTEISHYEILKRIIWFFIDDWLDLSALYLVFVLYYFEDEADDELTISRINRVRSAIVFQTVGIFTVKYIGNKDIRISRYWMHLVIFCLALVIFTEPMVRYWQDKKRSRMLAKNRLYCFKWRAAKKSQPKKRLQAQQQQNYSDSESEDEIQERQIAREQEWRWPSREAAVSPPIFPAGRVTTRSVSRARSPEFCIPAGGRLQGEPPRRSSRFKSPARE